MKETAVRKIALSKRAAAVWRHDDGGMAGV
jgi:hypothetical protein